MAQLPALVSTEATRKRELGTAHTPPLKLLSGKSTAHRSSLLPQLSVTTASSLRPARVKSTMAAGVAAPTTVSAESPVCRSTDPAAPLPLLSQLLRISVPAASSTLVQTPEEVTVKEAMEALGELDAVEVLFVHLNHMAHSNYSSDDGAFADAIAVVEGHAAAVMDEIGESDARAIPPARADCHAATTTPTVAHQRRSWADSPNAVLVSRRSYLPCLVLCVQCHRGVLALHIVNLRFEGASGKSHCTLRAATLDREGQQKKDSSGETQRRQRRTTVKPQRLQPSYRNERASTTAVGGVPSGLPPSPSNDEGVVEATGVGELASVSSDLVETVPSLFPVARADATGHRASVASPKHSQRPWKGKSGLRQRSSTMKAAHHSITRSSATAVSFDPFRPEETTPFNAQYRPITYNAAIVLQSPL
ncbi:hypothetical protein Q4I32_005723 [Leishmania shawi]|uniref:Uncharacterized protein n=1 Tax=Leishmania shawi TaxID=5680 RepID=A0AAW3BK77_9TRYP